MNNFAQIMKTLVGWNPPGRRAKKRLFAVYPARVYLSTAKGSVTVGVVMLALGFTTVAQPLWQLTVGNQIAIEQQKQTSENIFGEEPQIIAIGDGTVDSENTVTVEAKPALPNIDDGVQPGQIFARMYVPRFGEDYERIIAHGTYTNVLRHAMGHYDNTELPGQSGNFAIAGHRTTYGASLLDIDKLEKGDRVVVETADSFYLYEHNNTAIVEPTDVNVLVDEPEFFLGESKNQTLLTLTSCHPKYSDEERIVAFSVLMNVFDKNETTLDDVLKSEQTFKPYQFPYTPDSVDNMEEPSELVGE